MPVPMINVLNGGAHADNSLDFQEFMVLPVGAASFAEAVRMGAEVFHALKDALKRAGHSVNVGDEGGFAPDLRAAEEALDFLMAAIGQAGLRPGQDVALGLDPAASEFHRPAGYVYAGQDRRLSAEEQVDYLAALTRAYPIIAIEDGMAEDDPAGWKMLTERLGASCQLVGDDVFCTNPRLFEQGIGQGLANAILVKPNQIGTLTEMQQVLRLAARNGYRVVMSHRSGETEDTSIADLAVAGHCGGIKTGSMSRSDRTAKYNRLLRIERELGAAAVYAGALPPGRDCRRHLRAKIFSQQGTPMRAHANAGRRWVALAAMALFVFQALIASSALASSGQGSGQAGATTIICTASGPRVVALDSEDAAQHASQQGGALPQCCTAGCAMPGGITPPALFLYSWLAPVIHHAAPAPAAAPYLSSALARLPQRSRAPPAA